ncbi:mariner Mos1 transposase [Trichonephila clavipes]|nr:mariner Mos1 transposase [Trichonephila clavipes]
MILLHDNTPSHTTKSAKDTLKSLRWYILPHPPYTADLAPSDYPLLAPMRHTLAEQHLSNFEDVGKWLDEWFATKDKQFFWYGEIPTTYATLEREDYRPSRRRVGLSRNRSSCRAEQFHSDASLEAVDPRAPNNSKNWLWMMEGDVSPRRSTPAPHGGE